MSYPATPVAAHTVGSPRPASSSSHSHSAPLFSTPPNDVVRRVIEAMIEAFLEGTLGDNRFPSLNDFRESVQKISPALLSLGVSESTWRDFHKGVEGDIANIEEHERLLSEGRSLEDYEKDLSSTSAVLATLRTQVLAGEAIVKEDEDTVQEFHSQRLIAVTSHHLLQGDLKRVENKISILRARRRDIIQQMEEAKEQIISIHGDQQAAEEALQLAQAGLETWNMAQEDAYIAQSTARSALVNFKNRQAVLQKAISERRQSIAVRAAGLRSTFKMA